MTVEIRQAGAEWLVEVRGEPIGTALTAVEALELAVYWERRLACVATWRVSQERPPLPNSTKPHSRSCSALGSKHREFGSNQSVA